MLIFAIGMKNLLHISLFILLFILHQGCKKSDKTTQTVAETPIAVKDKGLPTDTLRVVTLYGPISYFDYRGDTLGFEYENVKKFAEEQNLILDVKVKNNVPELIESLNKGEADLAAYPIPFIAEYNSEIIHCGPKEINCQVLVQKTGGEQITDVTQLVGKEVYVEKDSKYQYRIENLNKELGGGIKIKTVANDTIDTEDYLRMVSRGDIDYTVIDSDIAMLHKGDYSNIDTSLHVSLDQAASWAVAPDHKKLAQVVDAWEKKVHDSPMMIAIYKKYFSSDEVDENDKVLKYFIEKNLKGGSPVSPYDDLFRRYAPQAGFDWQLLAAIAYVESRYNPSAQSRFGASGLMQVMPSTGLSHGVEPSALFNPERNVYAASKVIAKLNNSLADKVKDPNERMKFILAGYNAGLGHVYDAMALAGKHGMDPTRWNGSVSVAALMKSRPEYYNDPVVKHGYFRGRETVDFVDKVTRIYNYLKENKR